MNFTSWGSVNVSCFLRFQVNHGCKLYEIIESRALKERYKSKIIEKIQMVQNKINCRDAINKDSFESLQKKIIFS